MKLENCGRCGLEPEVATKPTEWARCPIHGPGLWEPPSAWNAAQFAARTERINAAAVALAAGDWASASGDTAPEQVVAASVKYIDAQDAAARVRWAEMQKGE